MVENQHNRRKTRLLCVFVIVLAAGLSLRPVPAQASDGSRGAVTNLKAYAAYKAGDYDKARTIWEGLAAKGNTTALINLANMFQQGQGVGEDQQRALALVTQAAELGDKRAQYELGTAYESGTVLERDIDKAAYWLKQSAENGSPDGQFAYGIMLATARGAGLDRSTPAARKEALGWLTKAKDNGHLEAGDYIATLTELVN
ncbi:MAG: tetratricopeptide repeat protein [Pseudomonadota bacterium]